jgi:polyisoprenoid-binding protein YceI
MGDRCRCRSGRAGCGNPVYLHPLHRGPAACTARPARQLTCRIPPYPAGEHKLGKSSRRIRGGQSGSVVGYRVKEILLGQDNIAVGRTRSVAGHMTIAGGALTQAAFTVQMATIRSDQTQRDAQFDGRIMAVSAYPTGTFSLTRPIRLGPLPAIGTVRAYSATGDLTLHGHTRKVTFTVSAKRTAGSITISGSIPVKFADWSIPNPSFGSFVTTQNHGSLEFLLTFART